MKLPRRRNFLHLAAGAAALPVVSRVARAQAYPSRPVRCIVGYPPGGGTNIFVRLVGPPLSERLGQPFIIENRAGAASNVATEAVVRAPLWRSARRCTRELTGRRPQRRWTAGGIRGRKRHARKSRTLDEGTDHAQPELERLANTGRMGRRVDQLAGRDIQCRWPHGAVHGWRR